MRTEYALRRPFAIASSACARDRGRSAQKLLDDLAVAIANDRAERRPRAAGARHRSEHRRRERRPALCIAARNGSAATVDVLLAAKADPNRRNRFGDTPMMVAALNGNLDVVRKLARGGAAVDSRAGRR